MALNTEQNRLTHLSLIKITGDDAASFLQGQLTNDIETLDQNWQYSGYCTPKGRLLALLQIWRTPSAIYALTHASVVEPVIKRLRMYVMRSKVVLELVEAVTVVGFENSEALASIAPALSENLTQNNTTMAASDDTASPLFLFKLGRKDSADQPENKLETSVDYREEATRALVISIGANKTFETWCTTAATDACLTSEQWLAGDIANGLALVTEDSSELFIPQMLNLDILGGINFKKGCYTGQEIVARMHYLGKLKQRLFVCKVSANQQKFTPGQKVFADDNLTKPAGHLVLSTNYDNRILAVLRLDSVSADKAFYLSPEITLRVLEQQPYTLPNE